MGKPNSIVNLPHIDEDGYFDGLCSCMYGPDEALMLGADTFEIAAPELDGKHFFKLADDKLTWIPEVIPTSAAECVGLVLPHVKQTARINQLRNLFDELVKGSTEYRIVQDPATNDKTIEKIPEKTLEEVREEKHAELKSAFEAWSTGGATLVSSLGYEVNSNRNAMQDVSGLVDETKKEIEAAKAIAVAAEAEDSNGQGQSLPTIIFMDANNKGHEVSLSDLETLKSEIIKAGNLGYRQKWKIRDAINAATTKEELEAIVIKFEPTDFSKGA